MALDALSFGPSGSLRFARNQGRSLSGDSVGAIRYPSPFFDIAHTYLPSSFKTMLRWCRYYFLTNPLINAVCYKMAEYPVTDLVFDGTNEYSNTRWDRFFRETLHYKKFEIETGLDYNTYGNALISIYYPFKKHLVCKKCNKAVKVQLQKYVFREYKFIGACQRCQHYGEFDVQDYYVKSPREIRLIRWNPEYITIQHNEATGESRYYYTIPPTLANDVRMAKRHIIETIPQAFIEALRKNKALLFSQQNIYHMQRPTIAQKDRGWGMPMILPVLKDTFYLQILRKAQEAIAIEHIVPLRILFPQVSSGSADPYATINMSQWRDKVEQELVRWRLDNNYIPLLPVPVGQQTFGGDGRALMLAQEYRQWSEHIVAGMGVPIEFVFGGMQYCQKLDTYVFTDQGMIQLKDLVPNETGETSLGDREEIATGRGVHRITGAHNTGMKKSARLKTKLGLDAGPSHDHRYKVLTPKIEMIWKRAKDLEPGDKIAVQSGMNVWPSDAPLLSAAAKVARAWEAEHQGILEKYPSFVPDQMSRSLARLMGYLIAEGTCNPDKKLGFSQADSVVMEDFLSCTENLFGYRPNRWEGIDVYIAEIGRRPPVLFLKELGVDGYSHEKSVLNCILRSPKDIVCNFLKAYFEGDGSVSTTNNKQMISCGSKSEELLKQIQLLLLNLGVVASRYYDEDREMWQLQVRSEYIDVFAREVGFVSLRKQAEISQRTATGKTHVGERIPYLKEVLDEFRSTHFDNRSSWEFEKLDLKLTQEEYTIKEVAKLLDRDVTTVHYHIKKDRLISHRRLPGKSGQFGPALVHRKDLQHFLENFGVGKRKSVPGRDAYGMTYSKLSSADLQTIREKEPELAERIEALAEAKYVWDEVVDVELFDFEVPMGDLTVDVDHSYVADGLVSHNSGSNVSMRILENHFLDVKAQRKALILDFLLPNIGAFLDWEPVPCHYKRFKMADDLQRSAFYLQLNQAGKLSDKSLLEDTDWDSNKEQNRIEEERKRILEGQRRQALSQASIQGEAQLIMAKYQMRGQKLMTEMQLGPEAQQQGMPASEPMPGMGQPGMISPEAEGQMQNQQMGQANAAGQTPGMEIPPSAPQDPNAMAVPQAPAMGDVQSQVGSSPAPQQGPGGLAMGSTTDLMMIAQKVVSWLNTMQDQERQHQLVKMQIDNPQLYSIILPMLQQSAGSQQNSAAIPTPEQRPARRGPEAQQGV